MSAIEWVKETIQAGVELAKENPIAAAAVGTVAVVGVGYVGYRVCRRSPAPQQATIAPPTQEVALESLKPLSDEEIDWISDKIATRLKDRV